MRNARTYFALIVVSTATLVAAGLHHASSQSGQVQRLLVPRGVIAMWSGLLVDIPQGWGLCDGSTYPSSSGGMITTPDLRERFVYGAADGETPGATGGSLTHSHLGSAGTGGEHYHLMPRGEAANRNGWVESNAYGTDTISGVPTEWSQNFDGTYDNGGTPYHAFRTSQAAGHAHSLIIDPSIHAPPYFKVAFIMKL